MHAVHINITATQAELDRITSREPHSVRGAEALHFLTRLGSDNELGLFRPDPAAERVRSCLNIQGTSLDSPDGKAAFEALVCQQYRRMAHDCYSDALTENLWGMESNKLLRPLPEVLSGLRLVPGYVEKGRKSPDVTESQSWKDCGLDKDNYAALYIKRLFQHIENLHAIAGDPKENTISRHGCMREIADRIKEIEKAGYQDGDNSLYQRMGMTQQQFEKEIRIIREIGRGKAPGFKFSGPA